MTITDTMEATKPYLRLSSLWATARQDLAARRTAGAARDRLRAELADYATPAERNDLNALLDTYPDAQVAEVRELLNRVPA
jgi:hypothetical protein